jgi:hypothetical protein
MTRSQKLAFCLTATISIGTALAQTSTTEPKETPAASSSPVAFVYVSRPTHVDGFAASSSGKLTPVKGSPFSNIALSHMSVTKKFLFGASDDGADIYTYSIASDGALKQVSNIDTHKYKPEGNDCFSVGPTQLDFTGSTLYNDDYNCDQDSTFIQAYRIESNGELQFLANTDAGGEDFSVSPSVLLGTNKYAYITVSFGQGGAGGFGQIFERESNGVLERGNTFGFPQPKSPDDVYTPFNAIAADATDHVAIAIIAENNITGDDDGPVVLASYKADSHGNLTTTSTPENMPSAAVAQTMSISPSGKLLAIGGGVPNCSNCGVPGFQVFHFNGSSPITHYTGVLHSSEKFVQFAWDSENHLYALSSTNLHVYAATSTSIKEVSGSPYSIPEASSVIVLSLK